MAPPTASSFRVLDVAWIGVVDRSDKPLNDSQYGHQRSRERIETPNGRAGGQCVAELCTASPHASDVVSAYNGPSDAVFQMLRFT